MPCSKSCPRPAGVESCIAPGHAQSQSSWLFPIFSWINNKRVECRKFLFVQRQAFDRIGRSLLGLEVTRCVSGCTLRNAKELTPGLGVKSMRGAVEAVAN